MNRRRVDRNTQVAERGDALRRFGAFLLKFLGTVTVAVGVIYGSIAGWAWLRTSERFAVRQIAVTPLVHADEGILRARAGLREGQNIFTIDLAAAAHAMEEDPWVAHVRLARELPDTLRVAVDERQAAALVSLGGLYAVDSQGLFFKRVLASDGLDLPVITGLNREAVAGERRDDPQLLAAIRLVQAYANDPMNERAPLAEVHVGDEAGETVFTLYCADEPVEVRLGAIDVGADADVTAALGRLRRVWDEISRRGGRAARIDLGNRQRPDWVAVRLHER